MASAGYGALLLIGLLGQIPMATAQIADTPEAAAQRYFRAEAEFDQAALRAVLDSAFVEVSPRGEVDERDKVLSFYAPDKKRPAPALTIDPLKTRLDGDTAVMTTQVSFEAGGQTRAMTVAITAKRGAGGWRLLSAQYTGVR